MAAAAPTCWLRVVIIAFCLQPSASTCPAGTKPFPSNLAGKGKINYANLFEITYHGTYKVINYSPTLSKYNAGWHPVESMKGASIPPLVLYQCGTPRPEPSDAGITLSGTRFFEIPIQKAALGWGGPLPFFELLSVTEAISLIDLSYITSPCSQLMEECTSGIHMKNSDANWAATASRSDVVFTDSFGTGWAGPEKDIPFQISLDPGSLDRAEWVRFVAAFFNLEAKADEIFSKIEADYVNLEKMARGLTTDASTEWKGRQPKVAWATTTWSGAMQLSNAHYKRDFVGDAGGRLVPMPAVAPAGCQFNSNTDGSKTLECAAGATGLASFKTFLADADVIIDESYIANYDTSAHNFSKIYSVTAEEVPALARTPPNIFRLDGSVSDNVGAAQQVGSNWFEMMPSQPQQLLAGLMEALWSNSFQSPCGFKFMRRAIPGEGQTQLGHDDCPYYVAGGNHDCDGIHAHLHDIPTCWQEPEQDADADSAAGAGLSAVVALATLAMLWSPAQG